MSIIATHSAHQPDPGQLLAARANPAQAWRAESYDRKVRYAARHGEAVPDGASEHEVDRALERIMGTPDLLASRWLALGAKRCDAVARVTTAGATATGFLVSPWLLITNHHVLPTRAAAEGAHVTFRYEEDARARTTRSVRVGLAPGRCFATSGAALLDYAVVAVDAIGGKPPGGVFGHIPLVGAQGKILSGQPVNIIQHPAGRPREIAVRNNLLLGVTDDRYLLYETDSEPGSSGAPVLNDAWELVALHSRGEPVRDAVGREIDVDGVPVTASTPESRRVWVANKGVRVSAIVADLRSRTPGPADGSDAEVLIGELLRRGGNA